MENVLNNFGSLIFSKTGTDIYNGDNLYYEEYFWHKEKRKLQMFFDDGALAGFRNIASMGTVDMIITGIDQAVPDDVFIIPADFKLYEE